MESITILHILKRHNFGVFSKAVNIKHLKTDKRVKGTVIWNLVINDNEN